ncbi:MAG: PAS domain S-box protein, partial [Actinobacteria bacterium]|nr:PAS domain S-box protein [Actinomycetota bacterium]
MLAVFTDVTQRHRTEDALRRSEERFRVLVQESADLVLVFAADGTLTYASPSVLRFFGRSHAELTGVKPTTLVVPEDAPTVRALLTEAPPSGETTAPLVVRVPRADGELRWLEVMVTNLLSDPTVSGIVAEARDVTDRVETSRALEQANRALGQSNDALRAVVENSPNAIVAFDASFGIWLWNPAAERLFGVSSSEVLRDDRRLTDFFDGERAQLFFDRIASGTPIDHVELAARRSEGDDLLLSVSVAPMGGGAR